MLELNFQDSTTIYFYVRVLPIFIHHALSFAWSVSDLYTLRCFIVFWSRVPPWVARPFRHRAIVCPGWKKSIEKSRLNVAIATNRQRLFSARETPIDVHRNGAKPDEQTERTAGDVSRFGRPVVTSTTVALWQFRHLSRHYPDDGDDEIRWIGSLGPAAVGIWLIYAQLRPASETPYLAGDSCHGGWPMRKKQA